MKLLLILSISLISAVAVTAQSDYKKGEFFVGYSNGQVDGSTSYFNTLSNFNEIGPEKFHGVNVSGVYNVARYVGLKGDVSATFNKSEFNGNVGTVFVPANLSTRSKNALYNVLGGVQIKDNSSDSRVKPFAHLLAGLGHAKTEVTNTCAPAGGCNPLILPQSRSDTGFAGAFGGGLDVKLNDRFDIRVVQIDYNPVMLKASTLHNVRIGIGIVIK